MNMTSILEFDISNITSSDVNSSSSTQSTVANENNLQVILYIILESCIAFFAFINNLFVVIALRKFKTLRTPTNLFVGSLAMADIAVAVIAIPSAIILRLGLKIDVDCGENNMPYVITEATTLQTSEVSQGICLIMMSSVIVLTQVSIFGLLVIAIDRYIGIHYPLRYRSIMTKRKVRICIVAVWFLSAFTEIVAELGWQKWSPPCVEECAFEDIISMEYMVYFNFFGCVLLPLLIMGALYILIFRSAKKQLQKIYYDVKKMKRNKALLSRSVDFSRYAYGQPGKNKCQITLSMPTDSVGYVVTNRMSSTSSLLASNRIDESSASVDSSTNVSLTSNRQTTDMTEYSWEEAGKMSLDILTPLPSERIHYYGSRRRNSSGTDISALTGSIDTMKKTKSLERNIPIAPNPLRPCGKAHSFSASSSTTSPNLNQSSKLQQLRASALRKLTNRDSASTTSSRLTLYENERYTKRMRRKSELLKKEFRAARSLASVVGLFAICWLPLHILNTLTLFYSELYQPSWLKDLAILLSHTNSVINPLIYAFKLQEFKIAFHRILKSVVTSPKDCFYSEMPAGNSISRRIGSNEFEMTTMEIVRKPAHDSNSNRISASKNTAISPSKKRKERKTQFPDSRTDQSSNIQSVNVASRNVNSSNNNQSEKMSQRKNKRQIFDSNAKSNIENYSRVGTDTSFGMYHSCTSTDDFSLSQPLENSRSSSCGNDFYIAPISGDRLYNALLNAEETFI